MNKVLKTQIAGLILIFSMLTVVSCDDTTQLESVPPGVQAYSLLGDTLKTPTLTPEVFDEYNRNLI